MLLNVKKHIFKYEHINGFKIFLGLKLKRINQKNLFLYFLVFLKKKVKE